MEAEFTSLHGRITHGLSVGGCLVALWLGCRLVPLVAAAPRLKEEPVNGFMGHYGYLLSVPTDYDAHPAFNGPVEVVQFAPEACKGFDKNQCVKRGMFSLLVMPKRELFSRNEIASVSEYVKAMHDMSGGDGEQPGRLVQVKVGRLKGWTFVRKSPKKGPFNTTTYVDGKKVSYVFAYQRDNLRMGPILQSLSEVSPHDDPPAGRGP